MTGSPGAQTLLQTNTNHYFHFTDKVTATQSMASDDLSGHPSGGDSNPDLLSLSTGHYLLLSTAPGYHFQCHFPTDHKTTASLFYSLSSLTLSSSSSSLLPLSSVSAWAESLSQPKSDSI